MSSAEELKSRIEAKRKKLEADLAQAKADAMGQGNEAVASIERKLEELNGTLRSGWDNLTENAAKKLNDWLKD